MLCDTLKELISRYDVVNVPSLGTFYAEDMPATFSDRGTSINPPYRKISFRESYVDDGNLLLNALHQRSSDNNVENHLLQLLDDFKSTLLLSRFELFGDFGTMKANTRGQIFFVLNPDINLCNEATGLVAVPIKAVSNDTPQASIPTEPEFELVEESVTQVIESAEVEETVVAEVQEEEIMQTQDDVDAEPKLKEKRPWWIKLILVLVIIVAIIVLILILAKSPNLSDLWDSLLYTDEELRLIRNSQ